jgi:hypothetical protein
LYQLVQNGQQRLAQRVRQSAGEQMSCDWPGVAGKMRSAVPRLTTAAQIHSPPAASARQCQQQTRQAQPWVFQVWGDQHRVAKSVTRQVEKYAQRAATQLIAIEPDRLQPVELAAHRGIYFGVRQFAERNDYDRQSSTSR